MAETIPFGVRYRLGGNMHECHGRYQKHSDQRGSHYGKKHISGFTSDLNEAA